MNTQPPAIIPSRLDGLVLKTGSHNPPGSPHNPNCELCAMEAAAYIYGFYHSDSEEHACPVIGAIVRPWNDYADHDTRQKLLPLLPRIALSRSTPAVEKKREFHFVDTFVRSIIPAILDELKYDEWAGKLRALQKIGDETAIRRSRELVSSLADFLLEQANSNSHAHSHLLSSEAKRELARALELARARELELARARERELELARARARALALELARALALELELARALARASELELALALALERARALAPKEINRLFFLPTLAAIETALDITE